MNLIDAGEALSYDLAMGMDSPEAFDSPAGLLPEQDQRMKPFVSVIVPIFEQWTLIPEFLRCIRAQTYRNFELLLVDNGSSETLDPKGSPFRFRLLSCLTPGSYAARNFGASAARGELLAFTDADCRPSERWLACAVENFRGSDDRRVLAGEIEMTAEHSSCPNVYEMYDIAIGIPQARYVMHGHAATANLIVPAGLFRELNGFDSSRFSGADTEFCLRATRSGAKLKYCLEAKVRHIARNSFEAHASKVRRIKGGQLLHGPLRDRISRGIRTLLPPLRALLRISRSPNPRLLQKCPMFWLQLRLWGIEVGELIRLVGLGKNPER